MCVYVCVVGGGWQIALSNINFVACVACDAWPLPIWTPDEFALLLGLIQQSSLTAGMIVRWEGGGLACVCVEPCVHGSQSLAP